MRRIPESMKTAVLAASWCVALCAGNAMAQTATEFAIVNARIFDAAGTAPYTGAVLVRDGRIAVVGAKPKLPKGVPTYDAEGAALLPGLFDLHTHWTPASTPATTPQIAAAYLATGVTTVNDFNEAPESFAPRRAWLQTLDAPHVNFAARFSTPLGHGADWADENTTRWVNSPDAARRAIDDVAAYKPDVVKAFTDGWRYGLTADNTSMSLETLGALVDAAHKNHLKVFTHTVTVERGLIAAKARVDVIAHSLQDRLMTPAEVAQFKASGLAYMPTLAVYDPDRAGGSVSLPQQSDDAKLQQRREKFSYALGNVKALFDAGVPVVVGTDAGMFPHLGATEHELELLVKAGLTPTQALVAGTATSASALGVAADRGQLRPGQRADLVLVDGAPWQDIGAMRRVQRVYVDGRQVFGAGYAPSAADAALAPPPAKVQALVDDFERADGRTALDTLRVDEADGGTDRTVQVSEVVVREGGGHALSIQAELSSKPQPFASAIWPLRRGAVQPADLRAYHGLRFELRGTPGTATLELRGVADKRWKAGVPVKEGWAQVQVPFADLQGSAWSGVDAQQVDIGIGGKPGAKVWLEVDDISFY